MNKIELLLLLLKALSHLNNVKKKKERRKVFIIPPTYSVLFLFCILRYLSKTKVDFCIKSHIVRASPFYILTKCYIIITLKKSSK